MAKVMICDDAAFMRMMIKDILTKNGYEIAAEAENGAIAVEKYPDAKPDLVLMDITMPDMDGIQALKKIKEIDPNANVIMCSAHLPAVVHTSATSPDPSLVVPSSAAPSLAAPSSAVPSLAALLPSEAVAAVQTPVEMPVYSGYSLFHSLLQWNYCLLPYCLLHLHTFLLQKK